LKHVDEAVAQIQVASVNSFSAFHRWDAGYIYGRVQLAGKVIEHELGYRAELARVMEFLPVKGQERAAEALATVYGARVSLEFATSNWIWPALLDPVRVGSQQTSSAPVATPRRRRRMEVLTSVLLVAVAALILGVLFAASTENLDAATQIGLLTGLSLVSVLVFVLFGCSGFSRRPHRRHPPRGRP
jgi:hypothetical protein